MWAEGDYILLYIYHGIRAYLIWGKFVCANVGSADKSESTGGSQINMSFVCLNRFDKRTGVTDSFWCCCCIDIIPPILIKVIVNYGGD